MKLTDKGIAVVEDDSHLSAWIIEHGRLDIQRLYLDMFRRYIPNGGTVVDVGACLGDHTITYADFVGPFGKVIALEPNPVAFECLAYNLKSFPWVTCYPWALGNRTGHVKMDPLQTQNKNLGANKVKEGGTIPMFPMDEILAVDRIDFLKIDAEGYESMILDGARKMINAHRPVMLIESNAPLLQEFGMTQESLYYQIGCLGYVVKPSEPHQNLYWPQLDVLCLPK